MAFAGGEDARPWVEFLNREVGVPPNLRECQWRLQPPRQYVEAKKLQKLLKSSDWDDGKKLPLPSIPRPGEDLDVLARETIQKQKLNFSKMETVRDVLIALRAKNEEQDGNKVEQDRQRGTEIRFGSALILVHESTGLFSRLSSFTRVLSADLCLFTRCFVMVRLCRECDDIDQAACA